MHSARSVITVALLAGTSAQADVTISSKSTQNMNCQAGVCTPTAQKAVLNVSDLTAMLASSDVTVNTGGSLAKDIAVKDVLSWTSTNKLTLDAYRSVEIDKPVSVTGTGALTITTNDGGTDGDLLFEGKGNVTFWDLASSLIINGSSYTLAGDIATLASDIANNPSGFYALANKIDARHEKFDKVPVPTEFQGTFEGLGQTISNLKIRHDFKNSQGFFAVSDGTIRDTHLKQVEVASHSIDNIVGALVGLNRGNVINDWCDGSVSGLANSIGGLVGVNTGRVAVSAAAVAVSSPGGGTSAGGLVGTNSDTALLENSHASGAVVLESGGTVGGLVGSGSHIVRSYAVGSVTGGSGVIVGGLAGVGNYIDQSYATGPVTVGDNAIWVGGLVGNGLSITNSYATGAVQSGSNSGVGGFAGTGRSMATSYSLGLVTGGSGSDVGGFVGASGNAGSAENYWDIETSGTSQACGRDRHCKGFTGLTTQQLQSGLPAGFDQAIWGENPNINNGFPYLLALPPT